MNCPCLFKLFNVWFSCLDHDCSTFHCKNSLQMDQWGKFGSHKSKLTIALFKMLCFSLQDCVLKDGPHSWLQLLWPLLELGCLHSVLHRCPQCQLHTIKNTSREDHGIETRPYLNLIRGICKDCGIDYINKRTTMKIDGVEKKITKYTFNL